MFCEPFLTIVCGPFLRVEAEIGECPPFELFVLVDKLCHFSLVRLFIFLPKQCQLNVGIDALTTNRAGEIVVKVPLNTIPSFSVTSSMFLL